MDREHTIERLRGIPDLENLPTERVDHLTDPRRFIPSKTLQLLTPTSPATLKAIRIAVFEGRTIDLL